MDGGMVTVDSGEPVLVTLVGLVFLAAVLSLDDTSLAQTWLCQPLPAGILAGIVSGDTGTGLAVGLPLQLLIVSDLPVGHTHIGEHVSAVVACVGAVILTGHRLVPTLHGEINAETGLLGWIILAAVLFHLAGRWIINLEHKFHLTWMLEGSWSLRDGTLERFEKIQLRCLVITSFRGMVLFILWLTLLVIAWIPLFNRLPHRIVGGLSHLPWLVPAIAVGVLCERYGLRNCWHYVFGGSVLAYGVIRLLG